LVEQKLADKVTEDEIKQLTSSTASEIRKQSFFFKYDDNKVNNNKRLYDVKAPGNPEHHPSLVLPHEHVDVQHYIDTKSLTPDKIQEIYALYTYLVDLHIS
jgi:hypothetical protein